MWHVQNRRLWSVLTRPHAASLWALSDLMAHSECVAYPGPWEALTPGQEVRCGAMTARPFSMRAH